MKIKLIQEPNLEFGDNFQCDDPKKGLSIAGTYAQSLRTHRSEINVAIIGTDSHIELLNEWLNLLSSCIEASPKILKDKRNNQYIKDGEIEMISEQLNSEEKSEVQYLFDKDSIFIEDEYEENEDSEIINKSFNPDFPGFSVDKKPFNCQFQQNKLNNVKIDISKIKKIINSNFQEIDKFEEIVKMFLDDFKKMLNNKISSVDICYIVIPEFIYKHLGSVKYNNKYFNFRRKLKALILALPETIPTQIVREDTLLFKQGRQDKSMIAWNFATASYYKMNCSPWSLNEINKNTCYIGISFHRDIESIDTGLRASIAQAFDYKGSGLVFRGQQFEWDSKALGKAPHLTYEYAKNMIIDVLNGYKKRNGHTPARVVIHKTTEFWNSSNNKNYAEIEGFQHGIESCLGDDIEVDFVAIRDTPIRLMRDSGDYPVPRGVLLEISETTGILYTTGYIPYFQTYPGMHMPHPYLIDLYESFSSLKTICEEILALSKMNFNQCDYSSSLPITIGFAQKVGEILQYYPKDSPIPPKSEYFYYM